jgi:uncharacterized protein (DUF433 family)
MATTRFDRVTVDPEVMGGKPCIRGLRFPVSRLLGLLASGLDEEAILAEYPYLEREDIRAALSYAAALAEEEVVELARCRCASYPGESM